MLDHAGFANHWQCLGYHWQCLGYHWQCLGYHWQCLGYHWQCLGVSLTVFGVSLTVFGVSLTVFGVSLTVFGVSLTVFGGNTPFGVLGNYSSRNHYILTSYSSSSEHASRRQAVYWTGYSQCCPGCKASFKWTAIYGMRWVIFNASTQFH